MYKRNDIGNVKGFKDELVKLNGDANNVNINFKNKIMLMAVKEEYRNLEEQVERNEDNAHGDGSNVKVINDSENDNEDESLIANESKEIVVNSNEIKLTQSELKSIFNDILTKNKAFLVDVNLLGEMHSSEDSSSVLEYLPGFIRKINTFSFINKIFNNKDSSTHLITFGIYIKSFESLNEASCLFIS